jgi:hypothetical protein
MAGIMTPTVHLLPFSDLEKFECLIFVAQSVKLQMKV